MAENLNAEIISIGTEILLGEIVDTNSPHIARVMRDLGINIYYMASVGDNETRIADTIRSALQRAHIVITCGGLGPTVDDMTRQGVAKATGRELIFHQELLDQIAERFKSFRVSMTENNRRQAYLPDGALVVENPVGTAPAFIVEQQGRVIISLPGVPREMKYLLAEKIVPYLQQRYSLGIIKARILRTAGIGESMLDNLLGEALQQQSNPTIGLAAHHGCVDIRITAKADSEAQALAMIDLAEEEVRSRAGEYIFGVDEDELEKVLVGFLVQHGLRVGIIEAGISGAVVEKLRGTPGYESAIAYQQTHEHPDVLQNPGETLLLRDLATRIAQSSGDADACITILCLPDVRDNSDAEQATAVAVRVGQSVISRVYGFGGQSDLARDWVSLWAMANVWRILKEQHGA